MKRLNKVFNEAKKIRITNEDRIVIFSDLHLGNGGFNDDFSKNADLFTTVLRDYYLKKDYKLVLNGDTEELYKFSIKKIYQKWDEIYRLFDIFKEKNRFHKLYGNHDFDLVHKHHLNHKYDLHQALRLEYGVDTLFIYHGHQTANILEQYSRLALFFVRYLCRMISNESIPIENGKRYKTEKAAYEFSLQKKIISILGHTHRPLFESLSRIESLKMLIENLLKKYQKSTEKEKRRIESQSKKFKEELDSLYLKDKAFNLRSSIYDDKILMPCLFNSGCVTGKRGITSIEIKNGKIALIYWFDKNRSNRYMNYKNVITKRLDKTSIYRAILKKDSLNNIFSRIKLLN